MRCIVPKDTTKLAVGVTVTGAGVAIQAAGAPAVITAVAGAAAIAAVGYGTYRAIGWGVRAYRKPTAGDETPGAN